MTTNPPSTEYLTWLRSAMRDMNEKAHDLFRDMIAKQKEVFEWCKDHNFNDHRTREKIKIDIDLQDLIGRWDFHDREGRRFAAILTAELALEEREAREQQKVKTVMTLRGGNIR